MKILFKIILIIGLQLAIGSSQTLKSPLILNFSTPVNNTLMDRKDSSFNTTSHIYEISVDKSQFGGENWNLVFIVSPASARSNPSLSVSTDKNKVSDLTRGEGVCTSGGLEMCMVSLSDKNFPKEDNFKIYVEVSCLNKCHYNLRVDLDQDIVVAMGYDYYLNFTDTRSRTIKFTIPTNDSVTKAIFGASVVNFFNLTEELQIYANEGDVAPTSSKYDFKGVPVWKNGKGIFLREKPTLNYEKPMIKNINYTVLVEAPLGTYIRFFTDQSHGNDSFSLGEVVGDILDQDENLYYRVRVDPDAVSLLKDDNIDFVFYTFTGSTDFFVTCGNPDKEEFPWKILGSSFSTISLTPQTRKDNGCDDSTFVIGVKANMISSFEITAYATKYYNPALFFGEKYFGNAKKGQMLTYNLIVYEKDPTNITIDLLSLTGSHDMFAGTCTKEFNCTLFNFEEKDEFLAMKTQNATQMGNHHKINIAHNMSTCENTNFMMSFCLYKVFIKGLNDSSAFELQAVHSKIHHRIGNNLPERVFLMNEEIKYFRVDVLDDEVREVDIISEAIQGETLVYASRKYPFPDGEAMDSDIVKCIHEYDECRIKRGVNPGESLKGPIYIALRAYTSSVVSLLVKFKSNHNNEGNNETNTSSINFIQLIPGYPLKTILEESGTKAYFKIFDYSTSNRSYILFMLTNLKGFHEAYISKYPQVPNENSHNFKLESNYLLIEKSDSNTVENNTYLIMVQQSNLSDFNSSEFSFEYSTSEDYKNLKWNTSNSDILLAGYNRSYAIHVDEQKEINFQVHTQSRLSNAVFYFFAQNNLEMNAFATLNLTTGNQEIKLAPTCTKCLLYIRGTSTDFEHISITLSEVGKEIVQVIDGKLLDMTATPGNPKYFYFLVNHEQSPISINMLSTQGSANFYLQLSSFNKNDFLKSQLTFPGKINPYIRIFNQTANVYTMAIEFLRNQGCFKEEKLCAITLAVEVLPGKNESQFNLQIASQLQEIKEGLPVTDSVKAGMFKYYIFHCHEIDVNIQVSVSPLRGDPDLFVSYGESIRPDNINFDWSSQIRGADHIQIYRNSSEKLALTMAGTYVIGVYGFADSVYSLHVSYSKQRIFTLVPGLSQKVEIAQGKSNIFEFYNFANESIHLTFIRQKGDAALYMNKVDPTKDFIESFPSQGNATWTAQEHLVVETTDPNYCSGCFYVINLAANSESSQGSLLVRSTTSLTILSEGQPKTEILNENESESYIFYFNHKERSITLGCILHYGSINITYNKDVTDEQKNREAIVLTMANFTNNKLSIRLVDSSEILGTEGEVIYFFRVVAEKNAKFSITVSNLAGMHVLIPGQPEHLNVPGLSYKEITFYSNYTIFENHAMELMVSSPVGASFNGDVSLDFQKRTSDDTLKIKNGIKREARIIEKFSNNYSYMIYFIAEQGEYTLKLNHTSTNTLDYTINLVENQNNSVLVFPDNEIVTYIMPSDQKEYFALVPENRTAVLDVTSCVGASYLVVAPFITRFAENGKINYAVPQSAIVNETLKFRLNGLIVDNKNMTKNNGTIAKVKLTYVDPNYIDYKRNFNAFPYTTVMYNKFNREKKINFTFSPMRCEGDDVCSKYKISYTSYKLYIGTDVDEVRMWSKCQVGESSIDSKDSLFFMKESMSSDELSEQWIEVDFKQLIDGKILYAQLIATSFIQETGAKINHDYVTVAYDMTEFVLNDGVAPKLFKYLTIGLTITVFLVILIAYYWRQMKDKAKKLEKRLKYELHDVRNIAGSISQDEELQPQDGKNIQYEELIKNDEQ